MSAGKQVLKVAGVATGVALGAAGVALGAERALARNLRLRPDPDVGRLGSLFFDESRRIPSHDGGSIYTLSRGAVTGAPTFLFSHGVTIDSRVWIKQFKTLPDQGARVVAYDHRGHGESVAGDSGHSVENLAADMRTVLEGLDLTDVVIVGHSMGGIAAQKFAIDHAEVARARVRGMVLLSTFARTPLAAMNPLRGTVSRVAGWLDLAALSRRSELGTLIARVGFGRAPVASQVELVREMLASCSAETGRDAVVPLLGLDLVDDLARIDLPTLVIVGTADVLTPPVESRRLARSIRGARLHLIERAGHTIMLERAEELDELLLSFGRDLGLSSASEAASA
jgi:pimeloyl-ACP methyl ester carboxylesterase